MFITTNRSGTGYGRDGAQKMAGLFLILFCKVIGGEIRGIVRTVKMQQLGHFMTGKVYFEGRELVLSGAYGNDGLVEVLDKRHFGDKETELDQFWNQLHPLPQNIWESIWADDTGHNTAGHISGPIVRKWATNRKYQLSSPITKWKPRTCSSCGTETIYTEKMQTTGLPVCWDCIESGTTRERIIQL